MGDVTTKPNGGSNGELKVTEVDSSEIDKKFEDYGVKFNFRLNGIDFNTTEQNMTIYDMDSETTSSESSGSKPGNNIIVEKTLIMKFVQKVKDIFNGLSITLRSGKDKKPKTSKTGQKTNKDDMLK